MDAEDYDEWLKSGEWGEIDGFPNYLVSVYGEIYNIRTDKLLKISYSGAYPTVALRTNGRAFTFGVHVLIARAFISGRTAHRHMVNHIDSDKHNFEIENLEWVSHGENVDHWRMAREGRLEEYFRRRAEYRRLTGR